MSEAGHRLDVGLTKDNPYFALVGKYRGVYCEYVGENCSYYNGTALCDDMCGICT